MKIVNRKQFLALPANTVYAKYVPCAFDPLQIKGESLPNDFLAQQIADAVVPQDDAGFSEALVAAQRTGSSVPMNFDQPYRDGCFDEDQLFAVFEKQDVEALIVRLKRCL